MVKGNTEHLAMLSVALSGLVWGSVAALLLAMLPFKGSRQLPDLQAIWGVLPWIVPIILVLVIPPAFAVMWGATILSPGLLAILFMTEISSGTISAVIWANEPFDFKEISGVVLITLAGVFEPFLKMSRGET